MATPSSPLSRYEAGTLEPPTMCLDDLDADPEPGCHLLVNIALLDNAHEAQNDLTRLRGDRKNADNAQDGNAPPG